MTLARAGAASRQHEPDQPDAREHGSERHAHHQIEAGAPCLVVVRALGRPCDDEQHMDGVKFDADRSWTSSLGFGVELAYDVYRFEPSSVAIFARANAGFGSDLGYGGLAAGVAYHH